MTPRVTIEANSHAAPRASMISLPRFPGIASFPMRKSKGYVQESEVARAGRGIRKGGGKGSATRRGAVQQRNNKRQNTIRNARKVLIRTLSTMRHSCVASNSCCRFEIKGSITNASFISAKNATLAQFLIVAATKVTHDVVDNSDSKAKCLRCPRSSPLVVVFAGTKRVHDAWRHGTTSHGGVERWKSVCTTDMRVVEGILQCRYAEQR
jgi:hypothetical protein